MFRYLGFVGGYPLLYDSRLRNKVWNSLDVRDGPQMRRYYDNFGLYSAWGAMRYSHQLETLLFESAHTRLPYWIVFDPIERYVTADRPNYPPYFPYDYPDYELIGFVLPVVDPHESEVLEQDIQLVVEQQSRYLRNILIRLRKVDVPVLLLCLSNNDSLTLPETLVDPVYITKPISAAVVNMYHLEKLPGVLREHFPNL